MGNRANFVVVQNQDWQLYYSHWAGCRILDALIGGPDLALRYARSLRPCAKTEWVDPLWADGGAVVDLDRRRLLFFGDELMVDMPIRRALLGVLEVLWPGYQICWAYDGTLELAGYIGAELPPYTWDRKPTVRLARGRNSLCHLVSVVDAAGQVRMWPLWWHLSKAWLGPHLLDVLPGRGVKTLGLNKIPEGGVHVDVRHKTVGAWQTADTVGIFEALPDLWSGWQTECWEDRFEEQVVRCEGSLRLPELDLVAGIDSALTWIRKRVFQSFEDSPSGQVAKLAELLSSVRPGLVVNDDAVADGTVRPRKDEWIRFAAHATAWELSMPKQPECNHGLESGVRTTIDLPDDLHKQALAIARDTHRTLSQTVADLMRRGLGIGSAAAISTDSRTGLPLVSVGRVVTSEDVRSVEDEE